MELWKGSLPFLSSMRIFSEIKTTDMKNTEYKTCDKCSYDILDDDGNVMEHYCVDNNLNQQI